MLRIFHQRFNTFDERTQQTLIRATFPDGYMRQFAKAFPSSPVVALFGKRHLMGWALVLYPGLHGVPLVSVYVNERYREKGIATLLISHAVRHHRTIYLASWNDASARLYERLRTRHPHAISVINWYDYVHVFRDMLEDAQASSTA